MVAKENVGSFWESNLESTIGTWASLCWIRWNENWRRDQGKLPVFIPCFYCLQPLKRCQFHGAVSWKWISAASQVSDHSLWAVFSVKFPFIKESVYTELRNACPSIHDCPRSIVVVDNIFCIFTGSFGEHLWTEAALWHVMGNRSHGCGGSLQGPAWLSTFPSCSSR